MTNALAPYFSVGRKILGDTSLLIGKAGKGKAKSVTVPRKCLKNSKLNIEIKQLEIKDFYANESFKIPNCMPANSPKSINHAWVECDKTPLAKYHTCLHPVTTSELPSVFSHCNEHTQRQVCR
jgi:hypothetical protein